MSLTLARKAWFGSVAALAAIWGLIFLSAGSLEFWQGWAFWSVFSTWSVTATAYFLKRDPDLISRRLHAGFIAERKASQKVIQTLVNVLFVAELVVPGLDYRFQWSQVPAALAVVGDAAVAAGYFVVFLVFRENSFASVLIEVDRGQRVISTGPYRMVRHPMYSGGLLAMLSTPVALGSYWALLCFPPILLAIVWRLLDEERLLARELAGYDDYRRRTRCRLIPRVW